MAPIQCHNCLKVQPYLERVLYCMFCGARLEDLAIYNAGQKEKQMQWSARWHGRIIWGSLLVNFSLVWFLLPVLVAKNVVSQPVAGGISYFIFICFCVVWFSLPGRLKVRAERLFPLKDQSA